MDERTINVDLERRLRESETRHRLLIESWAQSEWETDADGAVVVDSPSWRAYTGQTLDEWLGYGWLDAIHPDDRGFAERQWREAIAARALVNGEFRLRAPNGGWRWTNVRAAPVLDAGGRIEKWAGINIDIDARKRAEAALRESRERLHAALASAELGTFVWHVAEDRTEEDAQARAHFGLPPDGTISLADALATTFHPDDGPRYVAAVARAIDPAGPGRLYEEYRIRHPDGQERWMSTTAITTFEGTPRVAVRLTGALADVTDRKRAEAALQASEERQAFLLKLSDTLRPLSDPVEIEGNACRLLSERLGVSRVYYAAIDETAGRTRITYDYVQDGPPTLIGEYDLSDFSWAVPPYRRGETIVLPDIAHAEIMQETERAAVISLGMRSMITVPLLKQGMLLGAIAAADAAPRKWRSLDVRLVEETCERIWAAVQRVRAEDALRESEARFQQFARASAAGLWIRRANSLEMEFVSPAVAAIYGVEPDALLGGVERWAELIVPEDRDTALEHMETARRGEVAVHEFRIQRPSDGAFRWIRNTDFPLRDDGHIPRIGGIAEDVTEAKLATEHSAVLLAELQHRVRNIMALLRSITNRTAERAEGVPEYRDLMMGRLLAFARVQALLTRTANVSVGIASIVHDEVSVQAQYEGQYSLDGPDVALSPKAAEVLTLAIHELATNAVKYGALSVPDGKITVNWSTFERRGGPWLAFDWSEEGAPKRLEPAPDAPRRRGFGSELIEGRIPYELRGRGQVTIEPGGARCHLEFPLQGGASILETGAPQRASVFGGAIDMTGEPDLTGRRVLVVEDDYYLATDAARALRGAGAEVMGPCATEEDAREELEVQRPDAVVVDINLGLGPSFKLAQALKDRGVPFVFTTGYDAEVIPAEFEGVTRLEKPLQLRQIVGAIAKLTSTAP